MTDLVSKEVTSHRQLPLRLYQVSVIGISGREVEGSERSEEV